MSMIEACGGLIRRSFGPPGFARRRLHEAGSDGFTHEAAATQLPAENAAIQQAGSRMKIHNPIRWNRLSPCPIRGREPAYLAFSASKALILLGFLLCYPSAGSYPLEQIPQAALSGHVIASQGAKPLAGISVRLFDSSPARIAETITSEDGSFSFPPRAEGRYQVRIAHPGFQDYAKEVLLSSANPIHLDVSLKLNELNETVEVVGDTKSSVPATAANLETLKPRIVDVEPVKGDNYQSLLPMVAGVVRGPDGRINVKGASAVQSGLMVSSSSAMDPSTGNPGFELPIDAIETVDVLTNPYSAEYGRFSSGVTQIQTRKGESKWDYLANNWAPRYKWRKGHLMGVEKYTPRLSITGPLIRNRAFLAQSIQYRMIKTPVPSLPLLERDQKYESFDSFTRLDARLSQRNLLTVTFAVFPKKQEFVNLNTFNPKPVTPNIHNRGIQAGFQETAVFGSTGTLETTVTYRRYDTDIFGQGNELMRMYPWGNEGNYFNRQGRHTETTQWAEIYTKLLNDGPAQHVVKLGVDLITGTFGGSGSGSPVALYRADSTRNTLIEYPDSSRQRVQATSIGFFAQDHWRIGSRMSLEFGMRLDRDGVLARYNAAPRAGIVFSLLPEGRGILRGGAGLFYEQTPMNVAAFTSYERQVVTRFAADGLTPLELPVTWQHRRKADLRTPYSLIWNLEYDHRLSREWTLRLNYMRRAGHHEYLIDPLSSGALSEYVLDSRGRSKYWEVEATARYSHGSALDMSWSYVRSRSEADLNGFDLFFGNLRDPIIRPNQFSLSSIDVPHRFLFRSSVPIFLKFVFSSMVEVRSGFPYSAFDEDRNYVGQRNLSGRFPRLATLDIRIVRPFKLWKYNIEAGAFTFHLLNSFTPRDVQTNVNASDYGTFYNTIPRNWGFTILLHK